MKKLVALLLALVMVFGLVACGNTDTPSTPNNPGTSSPEGPANPGNPDDPATVKTNFTVPDGG